MQNSYQANKYDHTKEWYIIDATDKTLGRLATKIATVLKGKHKTIYTPHVDTGDYVIIINAEKINLTGKKINQKIYYRHSTYLGGLKKTLAKDLLEQKPEELIKLAIKGMMPKNTLGRQMLKKLYVYKDENHKQSAQNPKELTL